MNPIFEVTLRSPLRRFATLVVTAVALLLSASAASAGCGLPTKAMADPPIPFVGPKAAESPNHQGDQDWREGARIVGLWHVVYTANSVPIPYDQPPFNFTAPFTVLESYKTWHADGTEFENAFLSPEGGNICFGVWKDLGDGKVKLHHIGLMFPTPANMMPPFQSNVFTFDETDTVAADGKTYTGHFDFKLFGPTDVYGTGTPLGEIKGEMVGTRITVD
jgi:hypothetical protein